MNLDALKDHLRESEGFRARPYLDTKGHWTVGFGHLLPRNISRQELAEMHWPREHADTVLDADIANAVHEASAFPWWLTLDPVRQAVIVELVFNMGRSKVKGFTRMIAAIQNREYQKAARELLDSQWRKDVGPTRSGRLARMLETGRAA